MKLTSGEFVNAKYLFLNITESAYTVMAENTVKCAVMENDQFKTCVEPILRNLQEKAAQFSTFMNQVF